MNYFKPVREGLIECVTALVNRGKSVANLSSRIVAGGVLLASAHGNYAIFRPGGTPRPA